MITLKIEYTVLKEDNKMLLKDILKNKLYISSILLRKLKLCQGIFINNIPTFVNYRVNLNDKILVDLEKIQNTSKFMDKFILVDSPLDILYEDECLLIVNKPANMPVHPSADNYTNTLSNIVANYLKKQNIFNIHIITRLDKNTSGICVFAKNEYIQELFIRKKDKIKFTKEYLAICYGIIPTEHDIIIKNIARKENSIILREVNDNGDYAKTEYYVKSRNYDKNYTVIKVLLHTGKTHQIRVHMSYINYPLLGDELYSNNKNICKLISRQALHARKITFYHPLTNHKIILKADIPNDMLKLI